MRGSKSPPKSARAASTPHLWLSLALLACAAPACAAILGDDFRVKDDDDDEDGSGNGSSSSSGNCAAEGNCEPCLACECPEEHAACLDAGCDVLNNCLLQACPPGCEDVCDFPEDWGAAELNALQICGCPVCGALCGCSA